MDSLYSPSPTTKGEALPGAMGHKAGTNGATSSPACKPHQPGHAAELPARRAMAYPRQ